jgi:hypothetical protein
MKLTGVFDGLNKDLILRAPRLILRDQSDKVLRRVNKFGLLGLKKGVKLLCDLVRDHACIDANP